MSFFCGYFCWLYELGMLNSPALCYCCFSTDVWLNWVLSLAGRPDRMSLTATFCTWFELWCYCCWAEAR